MSTIVSNNIKIGMLSLGCPKTLVDSEHILGKLQGQKYHLAESVADCDVALLNTCAFIQDAQQESVDRILELIELKKERRIRAIVVMGCLVQKFPKELQHELSEVDAFVGSGDYAKIPEIVNRVMAGDSVTSIGVPGYLATSAEARVALTPSHYRYLKISEGCDHICTFCTIPSFRGKHRSRSMPDIVNEAHQLVRAGAKEIIVTGQDTTYYGRDLSGEFLLPKLLQELDNVPGIEWIRLLYAYPSCVSPDLMKVMRDSKHICHYLDMPLQHASDRMLMAMKRGITQRRTVELIRQFRETVPGLAIRTTFIVGFPGETEEDFEELLAFMKKNRFERVGIFMYSQEAGSPAGAMPNQVPEKIKQDRFDRAMKLQQEISRVRNQEWLGKTLTVLVEETDEKDTSVWIGRSFMDAPEVDGNVFIQTQKNLKPGDFCQVTIHSTQAYDLVGRI